MSDLILNQANTPSFDDITAYINPPVREIWSELNGFIQETFTAKPKITYSVCSGKPGWNVKYQKSGKAICTLYPEKDCLVALVVVKEEMAEMLKKSTPAPHPLILEMVNRVKPFNHTLWLMIPVTEPSLLDGVKDLLVQKRSY